jgi:lipopolysaccharide biosynthesis glycosyltransferase
MISWRHMSKSLLVTLADKSYVAQAKQLFSSAYFNAGWDGDYMLLSQGIPEDQLGWFRDKGILVKTCQAFEAKEFEYLHSTAKAKAAKGYANRAFSPSVFEKYQMFTPEFKAWEQIVYVDADAIIRAPIRALAKVRGFNASADLSRTLRESFFDMDMPISKELKERYDMDERTFNSGVMAFRTNMISDGMFDACKRLTLKYDGIRVGGDQSILNLVFYKKWRRFSVSYNVFQSVEDIVSKKTIAHFAGGIKPWETGHPCHDEWVRNLEKAEEMDLKTIPEVLERFTRAELRAENGRLDAALGISQRFTRMQLLRRRTICKIEHILTVISPYKNTLFGKIGACIKGVSPRAHSAIKKTMSASRKKWQPAHHHER